MGTVSDRPAAIITGSARGIGASCARHLADSGFNLLINYTHSKHDAEQVANACRSAGVDAIAVAGDVSVDIDCQRLVRETLNTWARLDVLVNNAGVTRFVDADDLDGLSHDDFNRIFQVNVVGAYQMARAAREPLSASPIGSIVNVSSHSGFSGIGSSIAYSASKGALNTLTLSLARTLAPDIRVNAICPGFVDTTWMAEKLNEDELAAFKKRVGSISPLKRVVSPENVAEAVGWFCLGGEAITGQLIVIDGGTHLTVGNPI